MPRSETSRPSSGARIYGNRSNVSGACGRSAGLDCSFSLSSWPSCDITSCSISIEKFEKISDFIDAQQAELAAPRESATFVKTELSESKSVQSYLFGEQFSSYKQCLRELEDLGRKREVQLSDYVENRLRDRSVGCSCRFECLSAANGEGHLLIVDARELSITDRLQRGTRADRARSTDTSSLLSESCSLAGTNRRDLRNKSPPSGESVGVVVSPESSISSRREPRQQRVKSCEKHGRALFIDENNLGERNAASSAAATSSCCSTCCRLGSHSRGASAGCARATNADSPTSTAGTQVRQLSEPRQPTSTTIDELTADELAVYELLADYDDYRDDRLLDLESVLQSDADSVEDAESREQLARRSDKFAGRAGPPGAGSEWPDFQLDCSLTNESPLSVSLFLEDPQQLHAGRQLDCVSAAGWSSPGSRADRRRALVARRRSCGPEGETIVCPGNSSRQGNASSVSSSTRGTVSSSWRADEQLQLNQRTNELPCQRLLATPHSVDKVGFPARKMGLSNAKNSNKEQTQTSEFSPSGNNSIDALGGGGGELDPDHKRGELIKSRPHRRSRSADSKNDKRADESGDSDEQLQQHQENCHCLPLSNGTEQQETGAAACDAQGSNMRALRDVAKVSVPSLAALQYLPAQLDRRKPAASKTTVDEKTMASAKPGPLTAASEGAASLASISESKEKVQHELSCWKNRLCLCNCISKNSPPTGLRTVEPPKVDSAKKIQSRIGDRFHSSKSSLGAADVEPASEPTPRAELQTTLSASEAQLSQHKSRKCSKKVGAPLVRGQVDGGDQVKKADDDSARSKAAADPSPTLPASNSAPSKKPQRLYKNFLSPSRLFDSPARAPSGSLSDYHENSEGESSLRVVSRNSDEQQSGGSLISRSLSRLSGRRPKNQVRQPKEQRESNGRHSVESGGDVSPTVDVPSAPQRRQRGSLDTPDSFNSLEDSKLTNELSSSSSSRQHSSNYVSSAPEVVLSKVEYLNTRDQHNSNNCSGPDSIKSCDMGGYSPTSSSKHNRRSGRQQYLYNRTQSPLSQSASHTNFANYNQTSPDLQAGGPFSLPGSPRAQRRHNNRSRSPRLSQSPVPFRSPAIESTKIEDGLRVCSVEHFEKHIDNIKVSQVEAQKRLFTAWINHFCPNLIRHDLIDELRDGIKLIGLLATLGHDTKLLAHYEQLNRDKQSYTNRLLITPSSRLKHLSNVSIAVEYLRTKLGMKLINLNPMDIVSGKSNVVLGLCWNIILHFQLERNFFKCCDTASNYSSDNNSASQANSFTSRLSSDTSSLNNANEDGSRKHVSRSTASSPSLIEEFTPRDLVEARNKLLEYINRRFRLKLTNLTSNLFDGDVIFVILKHLLSQDRATSGEELERLRNNLLEGRKWIELDDDAKLDVCFELANKYLNVPKLFSASDLRQQSMVESSPKLSLVYLSMLLNSNSHGCSEAQIRELKQLERTLNETNATMTSERESPAEQPELNEVDGNGVPTTSERFESLWSEINSKDRFEIDKFHLTVEKFNKLNKLVENSSEQLDEPSLNKLSKLKDEIAQVESLIHWINQADKLFESNQRTAKDLAAAIDRYQDFFQPRKLPQTSVASMCPTLLRQYRECLATAKQRVHSMEQTLKNWISYEEARRKLSDWLIGAETKLADALSRLNHSSQLRRIAQLEDLIEYFELEPSDEDPSSSPLSSQLVDRFQAHNLLGVEQTSFRSLSDSLISLGSNSSRFSALTSSKRAAYYRLFDDFELKCRLLAAMLEANQREALLSGVRDLKSRLRYISDVRVPQVVSELVVNIDRSDLSIKEQEETSDVETNGEVCIQERLENDVQESISNLESSPQTSGRLEDSCDSSLSTSNLRESITSKRIKQKFAQPNQKKNRKISTKKVINKVDENKQKEVEPAGAESYFRSFWNKVVRASKVSLSLNIILLICLAGICVVPLFNRNACCELSQGPISQDKFTIEQRPT